MDPPPLLPPVASLNSPTFLHGWVVPSLGTNLCVISVRQGLAVCIVLPETRLRSAFSLFS